MRRCAARQTLCRRERAALLPAAAGRQLLDRGVQPVEAEPRAESEVRPRHRAGAGARTAPSSCTRSGATLQRLQRRQAARPAAPGIPGRRSWRQRCEVALAIQSLEHRGRHLRQFAQRRLQARHRCAYCAVLAPVRQQPERQVPQVAAGLEQRVGTGRLALMRPSSASICGPQRGADRRCRARWCRRARPRRHWRRCPRAHCISSAGPTRLTMLLVVAVMMIWRAQAMALDALAAKRRRNACGK